MSSRPLTSVLTEALAILLIIFAFLAPGATFLGIAFLGDQAELRFSELTRLDFRALALAGGSLLSLAIGWINRRNFDRLGSNLLHDWFAITIQWWLLVVLIAEPSANWGLGNAAYYPFALFLPPLLVFALLNKGPSVSEETDR